jgi:CRP-like cAMP-binding protein
MSRDGAILSQRTGNALLDALSPAQLETLSRDLTYVEAARREVLLSPHTPISAVFFPVRGMVSLVRNMADGAVIEIAVVGAEGMVGWPALLSADMGSIEAIVQLPMSGYRLAVSNLLRFVAVNPDFDEMVRRSFHATFLQVAQSAACNQHHGAAQRLAKWLLMADDRAGEAQMALTHEFLSMMLGVRRASVTEAISALRAAGIVKSDNGRVSILDRTALERRVCECYRVIQDEIRRLAPGPAS